MGEHVLLQSGTIGGEVMRQSSTRFFIQKNKRFVTDVPRDCSGCNHCSHIGRGYCYCDAGETISECRRYDGRVLAQEVTDFDWSMVASLDVSPDKASEASLKWIRSEANLADQSDYGRGYRDAMVRVLEYFNGDEQCKKITG
jgi:hypothetical protein